jgi:putative ABC transport system permease protein
VQLVDVPIGFDPHGRVSLRVSLSGARYNGDAAYRMFAEQLLERAWAVPGVEAAAIDTSSPLDSGPLVRLVATDAPKPPQGSEPRAVMRSVTPDYFRALGMPVLAGRTFTAADGGGAARPVIINQYLAGVLYPGQSAVGRRLELVPGARTPWTRRPGVYDIVGVVPNIKDVGFNEVEFGNVYLPFAVAPSSRIELIAASALPSGPVIDALRRALAEIDPSLPVTRGQTLSARVDTALQADRFNLLIIAAFAAAGIVLAGVGIYGAMACAIQERSREFGIRLALGMSPARLVRLTLWESARFGLLGSVIGLAAVLVIARLIGNALYLVRGEHQGLLYGVTTTDPLALGSAVAGLIAVATLSGLGPARDAARVDPLVTLRTE